jgi:hypothetical protein
MSYGVLCVLCVCGSQWIGNLDDSFAYKRGYLWSKPSGVRSALEREARSANAPRMIGEEKHRCSRGPYSFAAARNRSSCSADM